MRQVSQTVKSPAYWSDSSRQTVENKNNTSKDILSFIIGVEDSGQYIFWLQGKLINWHLVEQWSEVSGLLLPLSMIKWNPPPLIKKHASEALLFFCDCFYLPLSSVFSLWNPLYLTIPPTPHPAVSACPRFIASPPHHLSLSLECAHLLAQSFTHLSYFSFSPTLFTYKLPELCLLLIPAQLANNKTLSWQYNTKVVW